MIGPVGLAETNSTLMRSRTSRLALPVVVAGRDQPRDGGEVPAVGHEQVEEARPRDLDLVHGRSKARAQRVAEPLRDRPRLLAQRGRQQQRGIRRVVAEVRLGRPLEPRHVHQTVAAELGGGLAYEAAEV